MIGFTSQIKCFFDALPFQDIKHILHGAADISTIF